MAITTTTKNPFEQPVTSQNPFAARAVAAVAADAPEGSYEYRMLQCAAPVTSDECEMSAPAVEIKVSWGRNLLRVVHLAPVRSFYVGDDENAAAPCDMLVPAEKLGALRAPLVTVKDGVVYAVIFAGAKGSFECEGKAPVALADLVTNAAVAPCAELAGAYQIALPLGARMSMQVQDLTFEVAGVKRGRKVARGMIAMLGAATLLCIGGSAAAHGAVLGAMSVLMPETSAVAEDSVSEDQRYLMKHYLDAAAMREDEARETAHETDPGRPDEPGMSGQAEHGESGQAGTVNAPKTNGKLAVKGPVANTDPHLTREQALRAAAEFGAIGLLNGDTGSEMARPDWTRDETEGNDPVNNMGNLWGSTYDTNFGHGVGLTGTGEHGGGLAQGIGLDHVGTIGDGHGNIPGTQGFCGAACGGVPRGRHRSDAPTMRLQKSEVTGGRLPPELIQRVIRANYGRFRACYETGLRNNPSLQGRVGASFVIGRDGRVSSVSPNGDVPDAGVIQCVGRAFSSLSFGQPEGGIVTVSYGFTFTPAQ